MPGRARGSRAGGGGGGGGKLGTYLISSGGVGAGVGPQGRELLLQAVVGAVAEAVGDPRRRQDPGDAGEGEEGEEEEFGGFCLFPALRERRDVAFLQGRRERQRLELRGRGARGPRRGGGGGDQPAALTFGQGWRRTGGQGQRCRHTPPRPSVPSPPGGSYLTTERRRRARCLRASTAAPRPPPRIQGQRLRGGQQGKIR